MEVEYVDEIFDQAEYMEVSEPTIESLKREKCSGSNTYLNLDMIKKYNDTGRRRREYKQSVYKGPLKLEPSKMMFATCDEHVAYTIAWNKRKSRR